MAKPVDDQLIIYILYFQVKPNEKIKKLGSLEGVKKMKVRRWEGEKVGKKQD
jgi:hypothetical protein